MQDDEPFILNGLQSYQMRGELLDKMIKLPSQESDWLSDFVKQQRAQGKLPVGAFGDIEFEVNRVQVEALAEKLSFLCANPCEDLEVKLNFDSIGKIGKQIQLVGWLTQRYQSGLVRFRSGKIRAQDYLAGWIDHLAMSAMGESKTTHMLGYERKEGLVHLKYDEISDPNYAKNLLHELVVLLYQGMNKPLCYFPRTALAAIEANLQRGDWVEDKERAAKKMAESFNDGYLTTGEGHNNYIGRIWPDWNDDLAQNVYQLALKVLEQPRRAAKLVDDGAM
jgi:exodeoxyribonuclease V gamma subunit